MTFSISRLFRIAAPAKSAVATQQQSSRGPVELQPQQLSQVAGGLPKGGYTSTTTSLPKGGWA